MIRERQATLRKFKTNPSSENLNKYKQQRAKTRCTIKEAKRSSGRTFISKINSNTNPKKVWDFMKRVTSNLLVNHPSQGSRRATSEKHIANLIAENFAQVSSTKNYSNQYNSIRIKEEKNKIKFTSDNTESYNQPFTLTELQNSISNNLGPWSQRAPNDICKISSITRSGSLATSLPYVLVMACLAITIPLIQKTKRSHKPDQL